MEAKDVTVHFRTADTFTDSLARLTGEEQKAVKMTDFDLQKGKGVEKGSKRGRSRMALR